MSMYTLHVKLIMLAFRDLIEEFEHAEQIGFMVFSKGTILEKIGLSPLIDELLSKYLIPLARLVYPDTRLSLSHHTFVVRKR